MIDPDRLAGIPLFTGLDEGVLREIATRSRIARFGSGREIWRAGTRPKNALYVVLSGRVHVVSERDGRPHRVHSETSGGTLGEIPLFDDEPYPSTVTAVEPTECLIIPRGALRAAIAIEPELAFRLLRGLGQRVRRLIVRLDAVVTLDVRQRLASHLLALREASAGETVQLEGSQAQLAEELGTVREVVVRALRDLEEERLIERRGRRVRIVDGQALADLAG